jgi:hypothetical protein
METNTLKKAVAWAIITTGMLVWTVQANENDQNELQSKRTKCEIYTRVMWYFRPVSHFNIWKKSEFYSREYFKEEQSMNSKFIEEFK